MAAILAPPVATTGGGGGGRAAVVGTAGALPVVEDRVALAGVLMTSFSFSPALDTRARPMVRGMTEDAVDALDFLLLPALLPDFVDSSSFFFFLSSVGSTVTRSTLTTSSSSKPSAS